MTPRDKAKVEHWLESNRARPQARAMRSAGYSTTRLLKPMAKKYGKTSTVATITKGWADYAGRFAKVSKPVRLSGTKAGTALTIEALGPAASLIQADAGRIIDRINARLGANTVSALRVTHGQMKQDLPTAKSHRKGRNLRGLTPTQEAELQSTLSDTEDGPLKAALETLGRSVMSKDT